MCLDGLPVHQDFNLQTSRCELVYSLKGATLVICYKFSWIFIQGLYHWLKSTNTIFPHFSLKRHRTKIRIASAAVVIGTLRVKKYMCILTLNNSPFVQPVDMSKDCWKNGKKGRS